MITYAEVRFFKWQKAETSVSLRAKSGSYGGGSEVMVVTTQYAMQRIGEYKQSEQSSALKQRDYKDGTDLIVQQTIEGVSALSIGNGQLNQMSMSEQANTLDTMHDAQAILEEGDHMKRVRRLTPEECEALQGYPKGWTDIGAWVDTKGKVHKESSDAARYKALGNSICLPFWFYMLRRLSAQYERPAMLGSLFDGIGGFPLIWEQLNGKGTARWASEIEEFPIAVTKRHFPEGE